MEGASMAGLEVRDQLGERSVPDMLLLGDGNPTSAEVGVNSLVPRLERSSGRMLDCIRLDSFAACTRNFCNSRSSTQ